MAFQISDEMAARDEVQRLLNLGLFFTVTQKATGAPLSHHYTWRDAMRAKTRKTRIIKTRNLCIKDKVNGHGENESVRPEPA